MTGQHKRGGGGVSDTLAGGLEVLTVAGCCCFKAIIARHSCDMPGVYTSGLRCSVVRHLLFAGLLVVSSVTQACAAANTARPVVVHLLVLLARLSFLWELALRPDSAQYDM
jgi:hypothetical protein